MANPSELVNALSEVLGIPEATIGVHDRNLRTAGLRSKKGRGRGATKVTARDAANLITAALASMQVRDSVLSVERYGATRPHGGASSKSQFRRSGVAELAALPARHSFLDALEALIASAADGSLAERIDRDSERYRARRLSVAPEIEVAFLSPGTVGDIRVAGVGKGAASSVRYTLPSPWDKRRKGPPPAAELDAWEAGMERYRAEAGADVERYQRVSAKTILRVAELITPQEESQK